MYDYVLQYGFDKDIENKIQDIKNYLKENDIKDKERDWLAHITIDLYNCENQNEFIEKVDKIVSNIKQFNLSFINLNDFNKETLFIEPFNKDKLLELKLVFDIELEKYRIGHRKTRIYKPHITLCTNESIDENTYNIANEKFMSFETNVKYIWIYNYEMKLIKQYDLEK